MDLRPAADYASDTADCAAREADWQVIRKVALHAAGRWGWTMTVRDQLLLAVAVSLGVGRIAQGAEGAPSMESSGGLAEVVVTATKQSTTVQTTPISITAVTGEQIASRGQVDLGSL